MAKLTSEFNVTKKLSKQDAGSLILASAIVIGAIFRIFPSWAAGFPINDGGMFYSMMQDLQANHYVIPAFTSYNGGNIPYVYPPLGFYVGAFISDLFKLSTPLETLRWVPGIINSFCITAFYFAAKEIFRDKFKAQISTLVFAITPHLTTWWSMGGGLTRSLGTFFLLLSLTFTHRLFTYGSNRRNIYLASIASGLTILSHPEASVYVIVLIPFLWLIYSRTRKGLVQVVGIFSGVLLIASPWILWIIHYHGLEPYISAATVAGVYPHLGILWLIYINKITEETVVGLIATIGYIGLIMLASQKKLTIPGIFLLIAFANPRTAHTTENIPLAMAAGFFICDVVIPSIERNGKLLNKSWNGIYFLLIPVVIINLILVSAQSINTHLQIEERDAMEWVANNTSADGKFLVITGIANGFCDPVNEWFPALSGRESVTTQQGSEWTKGSVFPRFSTAVREMQGCQLKCIIQRAQEVNIKFDYLYLSLHQPSADCDWAANPGLNQLLPYELETSENFSVIFRSGTTMIYKRK